MSVNVSRLENVVSHYGGLLQESSTARLVVESWGLSAEKEMGEADWAQGQLLELLAEGVQKIGEVV